MLLLIYALVGYGVSNKALCKILIQLGHKVFVSEARALNEEERKELFALGVEFEENGNSDKILQADWIVVSPSVKPDHPIISHALERVLTDLDVVLNIEKPGFIIGITGTNGKTTTCRMFEHVMSKLGKKVAVAGNVGNPVSNVLGQRFDYLIMELSSFQLFWAKSLPIDVGLILNIEPNHLDWHPNFEHYVESKLKLFKFAKDKYIHRDCETIVKSKGYSVRFFSPIRVTEDGIEFCGEIYPSRNDLLKTYQNQQNLSAVLTVMKFLGFEPYEVLNALEDFRPPHHRMELVASIDGVQFVNDSKSTSAAATIAALENYSDGRVVLILTGRGKNENYDPLIKQIKKKAKHVVVFGEIRSRIVPLLKESNVPFCVVENMEQAVLEAFKSASFGDVVLLSPAAASFDLYSSYAERGEHFVRVVKFFQEGK
ncbi:UDP-N-acetylmuramoyl-L-alanine--D-glutamate ligase [Pseudothermotoga sp.]|nr:UDP-N-acetylmuramoyl-L-alanine--D-glutamate ligase [Pseudothermotoga sp.]MDW8139164.1 UDP-N-acetylmuramoyl-L-alanine--D-glutamate ligase [Pseudothermotoga sp.]